MQAMISCLPVLAHHLLHASAPTHGRPKLRRFHEDALQSGLAVAETLGGVERPWGLPDGVSRIPMPLARDAA